jgi:hypothetical protein
VVFHIEELESPDCLEAVSEEMSDENMPWLVAYEAVSRLRLAYYNKLPKVKPEQSRAAYRRRDNQLLLPVRLMEFFELSRFLKNKTKLIQESELEKVFPPSLTNTTYWGVQSLQDYDYWVEHEMTYFLSIPNIICQIFNMLPWFFERYWIEPPPLMMQAIWLHTSVRKNPSVSTDAICEALFRMFGRLTFSMNEAKTMREMDLANLGEQAIVLAVTEFYLLKDERRAVPPQKPLRKPGVVLPDRPRKLSPKMEPNSNMGLPQPQSKKTSALQNFGRLLASNAKAH